MKYYSEICNKLFSTEKELREEEAKIKKENEEKEAAEKAKKALRATKAKEVEAAIKEAAEASKKATKLLKDFTKEYGYYHTSYSFDKEGDTRNFFNILNSFLL